MQEDKFIELNQLGGTEQRDTTSDPMVVLQRELATACSLCSYTLFLASSMVH